MTFLIAMIMGFFHPAPQIPWEQITVAPPIEEIQPTLQESSSDIDEITIGNIIESTNNRRTFPLVENEYLDKLAQWKADDMEKFKYWKHEDSGGKEIWDRLDKNQYNFTYIGENLGVDFTSLNAMQTAFMNSPEHRTNITNVDYKDIGVGISGRYVVILFGSV